MSLYIRDETRKVLASSSGDFLEQLVLSASRRTPRLDRMPLSGLQGR